MKISITQRYRRAATLMLVLFIAIGVFGVPAIRHEVLRKAGWALVANDALIQADAIVLTVDAHDSGTLEAADLVRAGVASKVALFADPQDAAVRNEFVRRGVPYETTSERTTRELSALGIKNVEQITGYVEGSEDEAPVLTEWCDRNGLHSIVVVVAPDHSRRLRRMIGRAMKGHRTLVMIRAAHFTKFEPDRWWESHSGVRTEIEEGEKLLLDIVRHSLS